jgi:hypothetical protein
VDLAAANNIEAARYTPQAADNNGAFGEGVYPRDGDVRGCPSDDGCRHDCSCDTGDR